MSPLDAILFLLRAAFLVVAALSAILAFCVVGSGTISYVLMALQRRDELAARERRPWK